MKRLNAQERKDFLTKVKLKAKEYGYKFASETVYYKKDIYLISCGHVFPAYERAVSYDINIKPLIYDDIYWSILGFDPTKKRLSTRAIGVSAPEIELEDCKLQITDNFDEVIEKIISQIDVKANDFIDNYNFDEYVINYSNSKENKYTSYFNPILKCLAYINLGRLDEAKKVAEGQDDYKMPYIETWGGKTFFDLVLKEK